MPHLGLAANLSYSLESFCAVGNYAHHLIGMSDDGVRDVLVTAVRRIHASFASCRLEVANVSTIVFRVAR